LPEKFEIPFFPHKTVLVYIDTSVLVESGVKGVPVMQIAVEVEKLTKVYGSFGRGVTALNEMSLSVEEGKIFGLIGPNGAGKTTLVKILVGLLRQSGGDALLFGVDVSDWRARKSVGYLPEDIRAFGGMRVSTFLRYCGVLRGLRRRDLRRAVKEAASMAGCDTFINRRVRALSRGMMQRLGLAAAFLSKPKLLFLDEPTSGVDPLGRKRIRDMLVLLRNDGVTVFLNSHLLSEVEMVCDRIAILNRGRVVREGDVKELTEAGRGWRLSSVEPLSDTLLGKMRKKFDFPVERVNDYTVLLGATTDVKRNELLDFLRKNEVIIYEFRPHSVTLEDVLIETVEDEGRR